MAKENFVYHGKTSGEEIAIYFRQDEVTERKHFFVLEKLPEEYQNNAELIEKARRMVARYNEEEGKKAKIVSLRNNKTGKVTWFVEEPSLAIKAYARALQFEHEIKKEKTELENSRKREIAEAENARENAIPNGVVVSENKYKKPASLVKTRILALGLGVMILLGSLATVNALSHSENKQPVNPTETVMVGSGGHSESIIPGGFGSTQSPSVTETPSATQPPETTQTPSTNEKEYVDYDELTYGTHQSSNGKTFIELADIVNIADTCFNNVMMELEEYNKNHPNSQLSYDASLFSSVYTAGRAIRESSLQLYVQEGDDITKSVDYNDLCRGSFKIGPAAIEEANKISMKLTGEKVINSEADLYDPVTACRASIYIDIQNYEYMLHFGVPEDEIMDYYIIGSYLRGGPGVAREVVNGTYERWSYSKDIEYYTGTLEEYKENIEKGLTDGSHDRYWQETYQELWNLPDWSKVEAGQERE